MTGRDIVVTGGSAGGYKPLRNLLGALPATLPAAIFAVLHSASAAARPIARLYPNAGLPVEWAADGGRFEHGHVYLAPPDHHLLVERRRIRLEQGPKEPWYRPGVDVLFRSAALSYGRRVVGIVLSGMLHDGTVGLWEIKKRGGVTIVQDPLDAQYRGMVESALASVPIDHCLPASEIAQTIVDLASSASAPPPLAGPRPARVLIVEDERIVAMNLERRLRGLGYEVSGSTGSGQTALDLAAHDQPDVVLMDIHLSGPVAGTEAARQLWDRFQIPVSRSPSIRECRPPGWRRLENRPFRRNAGLGTLLPRGRSGGTNFATGRPLSVQTDHMASTTRLTCGLSAATARSRRRWDR